MDRILVTGGAGFIGSALVRTLIQETSATVMNVDKLTYAGNLESLTTVADDPRYHFEQVDIGNAAALQRIFADFQPSGVFHLAAESHVDRSIDGARPFVETNVTGTFTLLEETRRYWTALTGRARDTFRFLHVSTDEVFGSLPDVGQFTVSTAYNPSSPYAASKAASDHLVRAWVRTYGVPCIITNCSNNYGPYQFPEKLIPLIFLHGVAGRPLPVYGTGANVRDWLYVDDHVDALLTVLRQGDIGATYLIGGNTERRNLDVVHLICDLLDELRPDPALGSRRSLITYVEDRPGHDLRYAIDTTRMRTELGWSPKETFGTGLRKTVEWYLANGEWCARVQSGDYRGERLGLEGV